MKSGRARLTGCDQIHRRSVEKATEGWVRTDVGARQRQSAGMSISAGDNGGKGSHNKTGRKVIHSSEGGPGACRKWQVRP